MNQHHRAESLAGAIALGEATESERLEYRAHVATCRSCLEAFGGEHEFERLAQHVAAARDCEIWEPDLSASLTRRIERRPAYLTYAAGFLGLGLVLSLAIHTLLLAAAHPIRLVSAAQQPPVSVARVSLEQRPAIVAQRAYAAAPAPRRMVVVHNVVHMARAPLAPAQAPQSARPPQQAAAAPANAAPQELASVTVHSQPAASQSDPHSQIPVWRRDPGWRTVAKTTTTALIESAPQPFVHAAESLQVSSANPATEAAPVGGETAINPQPPMIAYDEGAEGTAVFQVSIDERGVPTKCTITKSSGYQVLDVTVCKAAMSAKYTPKIVNGRAVPGVYSDAFTFRNQ